MKRVFVLALLGLVLAMPAQVRGDGITPGTWQLTTIGFNGTTEQALWLVKIDTKDNKLTATLESATPLLKEARLVSFDVRGTTVHAKFQWMSGKTPIDITFEGIVSGDGKRIAGAYEQMGSVSAAYLVPSALTKIEASSGHKLGIDAMEQATTLANKSQGLRIRAGQIKDADDKKKLLAEAVEADKVAAVEVPKLYREVLQKHPGTVAAGRAAVLLLQAKDAATAGEITHWAEVANKAAADFGPAWQIETDSQIVMALTKRKGEAALAMQYARQAEALVKKDTPVITQIKVFQVLALALNSTGNAAADAKVSAELKTVNARLDRLESEVVQVTPFAGRKAKSDRVVVMELFTGAQCPPCVAADLAFEALERTYKHGEVVLIQYHLHIPGPDPMTNADTEARAKYYGKELRGTPSTFFNGKSLAGGGGGMANAQSKFMAYREIIDPLLDTPATCDIKASAKRVGDKIQITTDVSGLQKSGPDLKLRLVLVEENIRFIGSNKLRFHHQVVRALPGGVEGAPVMGPAFSAKNEVDLGDLRKELTSYLDNYASTKRAFPQPERPLDMHGLRVIAFVQDDATHEILQAVQVNVAE
jgi:hypothetical protein